MPSFNKFNSFVQALGTKVHNLGTDTLKVMLTNTAPVATNTKKADLVEITAGNGYVAGGSPTTSTWVNTAGTSKLTCADVTFTATGSVGPFQYAVLYNSTATNGELIGWYDRGSPLTLANTDTFTVNFDDINGVLTIA